MRTSPCAAFEDFCQTIELEFTNRRLAKQNPQIGSGFNG
jgi:hypothetical protein